ncbi:MAG: MFS transporter [Alphaproteobacteria bacterium]|nr:MAG: MFS transporter [Alphaproteobacteria bacterium]
MPKARPHLLTLSLLAGTYILAQAIVVPSLSELQVQFETDYKTIQYTISGYLLGVAFVNFIAGPLSDRFGRRPIMLLFFSIFLISSLGCYISEDLYSFLFFRLCQSSSAAGLVLSRAIIGDFSSKDETVKMLGLLSISMGIAPSLAPLAGGVISDFFGAKGIFLFLSILGILLLILIVTDLKETHFQRSKDIFAQIKSYPTLLASLDFWLPTITFALSFSIFGIFFIGGPYIAVKVFNLSPTMMGIYLAFPSLGYVLGNILISKIANRVSTKRLMIIGSFILLLGPLSSLILSYLFFHPLSFFLPILIMTFGSGIIWPASNAEIVKAVPHLAGSASGLGSAIMTLMSAFAAFLTGFYIENLNPIDFVCYFLILVGVLSFLSSLLTKSK